MTGIAVIGAGHWGPHLIRNFSDHPLSGVVWVVEQDTERRAAIAGRFPLAQMTGALEDALTDPAVDGVVIATPTSTHAEIGEKALQAGKHVLVEKPMASSLADALRLTELADQMDLVLMVGHVFLFNPAFRAVKEYIDTEELGTIKYLSMLRTNLGPVRADANAAWDLATHDISIANFWLEASPLSVSATGGSWLNDGVEDVVFATLRYPGDVLVHIEASWLNPRKRRIISVVGSDRMLTIDDMELNEPVRIYNKGIVGSGSGEVTDTFAGFRSQIREGEIRIPHITGGEPLRTECEEFIRRIKGDGSNLSNGWAGARVVAVLEAIDRSMANHGMETDVGAV